MPDVDDDFGSDGGVHWSGDGSTLIIGASSEDSKATGVGGDATDNTTTNAGAAYVLR